jgi:hypothetical protein
MSLGVEDLFSARSYEARVVLHTASMSARDRKRMLIHSISEASQKILMLPNANPIGLAITVTELPSQPDVHPDLLILATCPQFEMLESSVS